MRRSIAIYALVGASCGSGEDASTQGGAQDSATSITDTAMATDDTATSSPDEGTKSDVLADASDVMGPVEYGPYPAGPYGNKVGDVLPDLKWQGYVNAMSDALSDTKPFVTTSLDALRRTARKPYALIHVSEYY